MQWLKKIVSKLTGFNVDKMIIKNGENILDDKSN
jgi:hypothetical protein